MASPPPRPPYMPEDVIVDILVKLPVKSLLRFRCVCKSWSSLITNSSFIAKHLNKNKKKKTENGGCLFVHNVVDHDAKKYTFAVCPNETLTVPVFEYLGLKLKAPAEVMGPCNGIFCLLTKVDSVALWNPATREFRALPRQTDPNPDNIPPTMDLERNAFGFGMDPFTNDYKVVSIRIYWDYTLDVDPDNLTPPACYPKHVAIYSLRDDCWRDFEGFFPECNVFLSSVFYTYMDGVYYWGASGKNGRCMKLSFHMGYEVFQEITEEDLPGPLPFQGIPEVGLDYFVEYCFGLYKDSLAWIKWYPCDYDTPNVFNVWVLKGECWIRELTVGPFVGACRPLGFWRNGELLVAVGRDRHLFLADPITLEMKDLGTVAFHACIYHESLVSVQRRDEELDSSYTTLPLKFDVLFDLRRDYNRTDYDFADSDSSSDDS